MHGTVVALPPFHTHFGFVALSDTGSPQTFITAAATAQIKACGVTTDIGKCHGSSFMERLRCFRPPRHVSFHSVQRILFSWRIAYSCPRCLGVCSPFGYYTASYRFYPWTSLLDALNISS